MADLRSFTLWARGLLTQEAGELLQQVYRLDVITGTRLPIPRGHALETSAEALSGRQRIEKLIGDEIEAGLKREDAVSKLIRETAFTHLNRFVAFKLMETTGLVRSPLLRRHDANGFRMWLARHFEEEALHNQGDNPNDRDGFGEAPRDRAYRHFLLWQCGELAKEIKVLFDPDNLSSVLFPRPGALKELIDALNADERKDDWAAGNEETVGWVYQYFNAEEKAAAFDRVFKKKKKFEKTDLPAATQVFTPRWIVRFLVENSLGRLWLTMHHDSQLGEQLSYLVPLANTPPSAALRPVKDIRLLDPATGTMHFGLVAFDLLAEMYQEELRHAGTAGWPAQPSVHDEAEIPGAILANNLFGIDIDLRAVQLAALALYLKAKAKNKQSILKESNLACADVAIFRGQHLTRITSEMALPGGFTRELFAKFRDSLEEASMMGSLVRLDQHFQNLESDRLRQSIDAYVERKRAQGVDESYFANETGKGLRLLNILERRYDIVFTNPPYMSNRNMNGAMSDFMKREYKKSKGDLYSAFIERCAELLSPGGRLAMIAQQSFMFISGFQDLRKMLLGATVIETMAHVGPRAFAEVTGEKVNTTTFVLRREQLEMERRDSRGVYFRLVKEPDAASKCAAFERALTRRNAGQPDSRIFEYLQGDFATIIGGPWVYWILGGALATFRSNPMVRDIAQPRVGLQTSDNFRFLRFWWEVRTGALGRGISSLAEAAESGYVWFPIMKGGGFKRWYGNQEFVVNFGADGLELKEWAGPLYGNSGWSRIIKCVEFYFRLGLTWSALGSRMSARLMPVGFIIGQKGPACFFDSEESLYANMAIVNSSPAAYFLRITSPTIMFEVGQLGVLPLPKRKSAKLPVLAHAAVELARDDSREDETTHDFIEPPVWPDGVERIAARHQDLRKLEREIDEEVYTLYDVSTEDRRAMEEELAAATASEDEAEPSGSESDEQGDEDEAVAFTLGNVAERWISYAVGIALSRFTRAGVEHLGNADGLMVVQPGHPDDLAQRIVEILSAIHTEGEASRIVRAAVGGNGDLRDSLAAYLLGSFFKAHAKRYRKRPIYWLLQSPKQTFNVYLLHERATDQTLATLQGARYLGGRLFQLNEQLRQAKENELAAESKQRAQWKQKAQQAAEELSDLDAFNRAIDETNAEPIINVEGQPAKTRWVPELDDGVLLNAASLYRLTPAWKKADATLDLHKVWKALKEGEFPWAKTAMRYWPRETLAACKENKSYRIAHGLE